MAQSLWYLRQGGRMLGPFPAPRIIELLEAGEVTPDWEVSLDEQDWLSIAESGQFNTARPKPVNRSETDSTWREERLKARQRWQGEEAGLAGVEARDRAVDEKVRVAARRDHVRTEALLEAEKSRKTPMLVPLLGVLALLVIGVMVWVGQKQEPIRADIGAVANCALMPTEGMNWTGCDKRRLDLSRIQGRNGRLDRIRLDDSRLSGADLTYAYLRQASLRNVDFRGTTLLGADLGGADLSGADLSDANLQFAVLRNATLEGARLAGAKLDKATWIDGRVCAEASLGECR